MNATTIALALGIGYLLGSVPWGLLLTRLSGLGDVRDIGSGSIGATNVLRTGNRVIAALTLLLDVLKGVAAVFAGIYLATEQDSASLMAAAGGLGAFLGHLFPVWLKFRGGKGVATFLGVTVAAAWPVGLASALTWLAAALIFRYSSLASLIAAASSPAWAWYLSGETGLIALTLVLAVLIFVKHTTNIRRLVAGDEPKIGKTSEAEES